ncbi:PAS domain S-box protein [Roseiconus nitratireducens]|uniref:protein-glutamate O-methyltransferase n=1 Tax=Roseiconus nitratireducens TaxID=2605748 RepID=A0A5M6D596_9BACT|nr:chemotaxis protein CheB [Roseiconus nitratireducens]KAA5542674.1 PAS domain S-box protein [Roseiconus nitratireducens]
MAKKKATRVKSSGKQKVDPQPSQPAAKTEDGSQPKTTAGQENRSETRTPVAGLSIQAKTPASDFPIVGVGASAGGLEALEELLKNMPRDPGMAFVIVTHQHPDHKSLLPELLGKVTKMPVVEADDGTKLERDHVYVGPPGSHLAILNGTLHRMDIETKESPRLPIDYFFRSLSEDQKERAICIVLSGTGTDGTLGLRAIKGESGMAMVQEPLTAKYAGMPASAQGTGLVDYVLTPAAMPKQLVAYVRGPYFAGATTAAEPPIVPTEPMQKIFVLLRNRTGHDFSAYKSNTIRRRIERRMNVHQIDKANQYVRYLQKNPHEIDMLFKELLISVTSFFRDPQSWDALAKRALPELLKSRPENYTLRAWVPGCASGEEVFSLAIVLRECMDKTKRHFDVQIFGTDLDNAAVDAARVGQYPSGIGVDVSPKRLERYFLKEENGYRIRKEIREMAIFAMQNVIKDPPFTKLDLLFCRNLLIYLNSDLQKRLLPIFHYALKPGGLLMLGPSETIGTFGELFEAVDKKWKIFRRRGTATSVHSMPEMPASQTPAETNINALPKLAESTRETSIAAMLEKSAMARFCPPFVVINDRCDIIHVHGRTGEFLELAEGQLRTNILDMAREGLAHDLASAIRQAAATEDEVIRENVRIKSNGGSVFVDLVVAKILEPEPIRGLLLVTFRPVPPPTVSEKQQSRRSRASPDRVEVLQRELQYMKQSHQATLEKLETSNEELKSTNEELQSTNEEMQSTNEELETSKEEMQSLNEELTTVNAELQSKVEDLSQANDDMQNLLNATDIATIFLDDDLNIKRFTEQAEKIIAIRPTDVGRPIGELMSYLKQVDLKRDCKSVLDTLMFKKREVETTDGGWFLMRIMPYRTTDKVIDGLVLTFVSIREMKEAEKSSEQRTFFEAIFDTVRQPLLVLDEQHRVTSANRSFYQTFRMRPKQVQGKPLCELGDGAWDIPELRELLEDILPRNSTFDDYEVEHEFPKIGHKVFVLNARRLDHHTSMPSMILLAMEDISEN